MKVTVLALVCQVTSHTTIALRFSRNTDVGKPRRQRIGYEDDLSLIESVGLLERAKQPFLFALWRAAQRFLVTADDRDGQRAAPGLGGPLCADFGMLTMNYKRAAPPMRLTAGEPCEDVRCKAVGQHNDRAMPGENPSGRFANIMQEGRRQHIWFGIALPAQHPHHIEAVTLIGDAHAPEEFLRIGGQDFVGLAQVVG